MNDPVEPVEHADHDLEQARAQNLEQPSVPNCTKIVRLFVLDPESGRTLEQIVAHEHPTRSDVFVVRRHDGDKSGGDLKPMSWLGGGLVDHEDAHHQHRGTVPVLIGIDRDQIEWQCDVPFRVSRIEMADREHDHGFPGYRGPEYPFEKSQAELRALEGERCKPIRSGPTKVIREHGKLVEWKQLYKAHFDLKIGGSWKPLDPDFYCDWR